LDGAKVAFFGGEATLSKQMTKTSVWPKFSMRFVNLRQPFSAWARQSFSAFS
jgi:hypothetical protein